MIHTDMKKGLNFVPIVVAILCLALVICGGTMLGIRAKEASHTDITAHTMDNNSVSEERSAVSGDYYDLTADGPIAVSGTAEREDIYIFSRRLYTNSCAISIQNNTDSTIIVYLYNSTRLSDPIQQFTLSGHDTAQFTNLTASCLYQVGFGSDSEKDMQLIISQ